MTLIGTPSISAGTGSVTSSLASGNQVFINLTADNAQRIAISLTVNDGVNTSPVVVPMGLLEGDVDANGRVDGNDVSTVQSHTRQTTDATNYRDDVDITGRIDGNDVSATQSHTRTALP